MSLSRVQSLRKVSFLTVISAVAILLAGSLLPKLWVGLLVIAILSFPFLSWDYIRPRQVRKQASEDVVAVQSPEAMLKLKLAKEEITQEQFDRMIVQLQGQSPR